MTRGGSVQVVTARVIDFMASPWVPAALKEQLLQTLCALAELRPHTADDDPSAEKTLAFIGDSLSETLTHLMRAQVAMDRMRTKASWAAANLDLWSDAGFPFEKTECQADDYNDDSEDEDDE